MTTYRKEERIKLAINVYHENIRDLLTVHVMESRFTIFHTMYKDYRYPGGEGGCSVVSLPTEETRRICASQRQQDHLSEFQLTSSSP